MNWFPAVFATANAALLFFGVDNPSRAFSLLPYLAIVALIRIVTVNMKQLEHPAGSSRMWGKRARTPLGSMLIQQPSQRLSDSRF